MMNELGRFEGAVHGVPDETRPDFYEYSTGLTEAFREILAAPDRTVPIVAGAYLEDMLIYALRRLFTEDPRVEKAMRGNRRCSFYDAIELGGELLELEEHEVNDLHRIREIRNEFAHVFRRVSFDDPQVVEQFNYLVGIKGSTRSGSARSWFVRAVEQVSYRILNQIMATDPGLPKTGLPPFA